MIPLSRTHGTVEKAFSWKVFLSEIIWRLKVQSPLKEYLLSLNTFTLLWLTELEQSTLVVQINGPVQDTLWTPEIDMKHLKQVEGHIARNVLSIAIKMISIV